MKPLFFLFFGFMLCCFVCTTESAVQSYWKPRKQTKCKNLLVNIEIVVKQQKIPCIAPLFHENNYVTDFKKRTIV